MLLLAEHRVILQWWYPGIQLISKDLGVLLLIATWYLFCTCPWHTLCVMGMYRRGTVLLCMSKSIKRTHIMWHWLLHSLRWCEERMMTTDTLVRRWRHLSTKMNPMMTIFFAFFSQCPSKMYLSLQEKVPSEIGNFRLKWPNNSN